MKLLSIKPTIYKFEKAAQFAKEFGIGKGDLVVTNDYIYQPYFSSLSLDCEVICQEKYGTGEPSDAMYDAMHADIKSDFKRIIAIGGGTIMDMSKLLALKNPPHVIDLFDGKTAPVKEKELVLVPTTCGTGSEVTNIAILSLTSRNTKKGLAVNEMYADSAVLVPELLNSLPFSVFAASSIDALIHAVESTLSPKGNNMTRLYGYKAMEMILEGYKKIADEGKDARKELLSDFLMASNYAGIAFSNAGCAAVHALSYPLGATFHVPHGESNYAVFTGVMHKYEEKNCGGALAELKEFLAGILGCKKDAVFAKLEQLLNQILQKKSLYEYGMTKEQIDEFANSVIENQQRLLKNNFVKLTQEDFRAIYKSLYE